jgi:hypothetical protein
MKKLLPILALAAIMAVVACSDKKTTNPNPPGNNAVTVWVSDSTGEYWLSTVDGSSYDYNKYFGFSGKDTVSLTDNQALTDTLWDIGFKRTVVKTNGGISGSKDVKVVDLTKVHSPDSINFAGVTDTTGIRDRDWQEDTYDYAIGDWYIFDMMHHPENPTNYVYTLVDADSHYVKFTVSGMYGGGPLLDMGNLIIKYVYAASGTDISGPEIIDTIHVGPDTAYYDFSSGETVTPPDPFNSTDWDIAIANNSIHLNSGMFGQGYAAAYLNTDDSNIPRTDFDSISVAETQPTAYSIDVAGSAFTGWYNYDSGSHSITSKGHVYLVKLGADIYKMQITSYKANVNGIPTSGWYIFRWLKLEL